MEQIYDAKQCGVRLVPPALVLVYKDMVSHKMRRRIMPVRDLTPTSDVSDIARQLGMRHKSHLDGVPEFLVRKMLRILQEHLKGLTLEEALEMVQVEFEQYVDEDKGEPPQHEKRQDADCASKDGERATNVDELDDKFWD